MTTVGHYGDSASRPADIDGLPSPGRYTIDPHRTVVEFVARHLVVKRVRGRFHDVTGTIVVDDVVERSHAEAEIRAASIDTGISARDKHLRSADFFDVDEHPTVTFRSTRIDAGEPGTWAVGGDVTILGVLHPLDLDVTLGPTSASSRGHRSLALRATAVVDREAWGLTWNARAESGGLLIGRAVDLRLLVRADLTEA